MISIDSFKQLALSFPDATEEPHFEKVSYRVKKKIFATLDEPKKIVYIKLSATDQDVFCLIDKEIIYPGTEYFYNLSVDPFELTNLLATALSAEAQQNLDQLRQIKAKL